MRHAVSTHAVSTHALTDTPAAGGQVRRSGQAPARPAPRRRYLTQAERRRAAHRRAREALEQGIALGSCVLLTLTTTRVRSDGTRGRDYDTEPTLRSEVWHLLWTRITRRWPEAQAFTVLEWGKRSGVHLHVVVRDAPGLTEAWMRAALSRRYPLVDLHLEDVYGGHRLTWYLTKSLSSDALSAGWGRYTHPTSQSRHWLPRAASSADSFDNEG